LEEKPGRKVASDDDAHTHPLMCFMLNGNEADVGPVLPRAAVGTNGTIGIGIGIGIGIALQGPAAPFCSSLSTYSRVWNGSFPE
jgi:hypothetical protein